MTKRAGLLVLILVIGWAVPGFPATNGIVNFGRVNEFLYRGAQPDFRGLRQLDALGVKSIINLRMTNEVWPAEAAAASVLSMAYTNIPLDNLSAPTDAQVAQVLAARNRDGEARTALLRLTGTSPNDSGWDSDPGLSTPRHDLGDTYQLTFNEPGTYTFQCKLHAGVRGSVIVSDVWCLISRNSVPLLATSSVTRLNVIVLVFCMIAITSSIWPYSDSLSALIATRSRGFRRPATSPILAAIFFLSTCRRGGLRTWPPRHFAKGSFR